MTIELKQAAQQALLALEKSQPHPSNPVIGLTKQDFIDHEETIRQLRTAIQQAEAQQPATGEPVAQWQKRHPVRTGGRWISTDEHDAKWWSERATGWEARALYTHPAPSVPDGYALVRIEPTVGMLIAGAESRISQEQPTREHAVWAAMLADK